MHLPCSASSGIDVVAIEVEPTRGMAPIGVFSDGEERVRAPAPADVCRLNERKSSRAFGRNAAGGTVEEFARMAARGAHVATRARSRVGERRIAPPPLPREPRFELDPGGDFVGPDHDAC